MRNDAGICSYVYQKTNNRADPKGSSLWERRVIAAIRNKGMKKGENE
jgi:hypothetical protein